MLLSPDVELGLREKFAIDIKYADEFVFPVLSSKGIIDQVLRSIRS